MHNVAKFALASLVHHAEYLREVLHPNHIIFETILFRNSQLLNALKEMIITGHASNQTLQYLMFGVDIFISFQEIIKSLKLRFQIYDLTVDFIFYYSLLIKN